MRKGYNVYYLQKDIDNEVDSKTIFFTEDKELVIKYVDKYNNILITWKNYFLNTEIKEYQYDRRDVIDSIVGCYYEEVSVRDEITTRDFSRKVLELQDIAKIRAYELHLAKGGVTCYGGYNPKWDNFGIKVYLDEETTNSEYKTFEQDVVYELLDKSDKDWQEYMQNHWKFVSIIQILKRERNRGRDNST